MRKQVFTALLISTILVPTSVSFAATEVTTTDTSVVSETEVTSEEGTTTGEVVGGTQESSTTTTTVETPATETPTTETTTETPASETTTETPTTETSTSKTNIKKEALKAALITKVNDEAFVVKALADGLNARQIITVKTFADLTEKSLDDVLKVFIDNEKGIGATAKELKVSSKKALSQINKNYKELNALAAKNVKKAESKTKNKKEDSKKTETKKTETKKTESKQTETKKSSKK
jgi:hypothetical protein